jgi:hypothetical protein
MRRLVLDGMSTDTLARVSRGISIVVLHDGLPVPRRCGLRRCCDHEWIRLSQLMHMLSFESQDISSP